jgi:hypothetical protein
MQPHLIDRLQGNTLGPRSLHVEVISGVFAYSSSVPLPRAWHMKVSAVVSATREMDGGCQMHALEAAATSKIGDDEMSLRAYLDA